MGSLVMAGSVAGLRRPLRQDSGGMRTSWSFRRHTIHRDHILQMWA